DEVARDRRGAEEPFESALGQIRCDRLTGEERNAVFFGDCACGECDAGLIGAGEGRDLLFGDQAQRLVLSSCRTALVVREHHFDLSAAEPRESGILGEWEIAELGMSV